MQSKHSVSLAIHHADGRVLQVRRPPDDEELPDVWGLPAASLRGGESWEDTVRRAARDKLGLVVEPVRVLNEGEQERPEYRLVMRLYEARVVEGTPGITERDPSVTRYADWRWGPAGNLHPAAAQGSLCSILYLEQVNETAMIQLDLTPQEKQTLVEVLDNYLSDLRMEISDTDSQDFREKLKVRKAVVQKTLEGLRGQG